MPEFNPDLAIPVGAPARFENISEEDKQRVIDTFHVTPVGEGKAPKFDPSKAVPVRAPVPESFWEEFKRTRQEQLEAGEIKPRPDINMFKTPGKAIGQALATANLPFAYTGIGPLLDVAGRRYIEEPLQHDLGMILPKPIADVLARTGNLAAQMFLPGPLLEGTMTKIARPGVLQRLSAGEQMGKEAIQTGEEATALREAKIPRAEQAEEAISGQLKGAQRSLKRGEAEVAAFPEQISPRKMSIYEAGAEYGGTTTQVKPRTEELGLYGNLAKQSSEYFNKLYRAIDERVKTVKVPVEELNEIKTGVFEGIANKAAYDPNIQVAIDILNQKHTPEQVAKLQKAMNDAEKEGRAFGVSDLAAAIAETEGKQLDGAKILERVRVLRNQARASGSDLVEFLRNDLADRYMERLKQGLQQAGKADAITALEMVNEKYRQSRELFGVGAIPRKLADQEASDIIHAMFGPGKASVERARTMRQFLPKDRFDAYVRTFHEDVFDPANMQATLKEWKKLGPEVKAEMYGPDLAANLDRIVAGIEKDQKRIGLLTEAQGAVGKYTKGLEKQSAKLDQQMLKLSQNAVKLGYRIDPNSPLGQLVQQSAVRAARSVDFGTYLAIEHLGLGLTNLAAGNVGAAGFQMAKGILYGGRRLLPEISKSARGAKVAADFLNANQDQIWAYLALRKYMADNGINEQAELQKLGLIKVQ
jgi:hypothetical protein